MILRIIIVIAVALTLLVYTKPVINFINVLLIKGRNAIYDKTNKNKNK